MGGSITRVTDERQSRVIFHDNFPPATCRTSSCFPGRIAASSRFYRKQSASFVTVFTSRDDPHDYRDQEHRFWLKVGETKILSDSFGRSITVKRIRHRDFVLFPVKFSARHLVPGLFYLDLPE